MNALAEHFGDMQLSSVKTLLASGNVAFKSNKRSGLAIESLGA